MSKSMPKITDMSVLFEGLSERDRKIVLAVVKKDGTIRATKPSNGVAAYVWRMVAFIVSPKPEHHCVPVTADFGIEEKDYAHRTETYQPRLESDSDRETIARWDSEPDRRTWKMMNDGAKMRAFIKDELDPLADRIIDCVKKSDWNGARRWAKAYGVI